MRRQKLFYAILNLLILIQPKLQLELKLYFLSSSGKNLVVKTDSNFEMSNHKSNVCRAVYFEICRLRHMSSFVDQSSLKTLASSLFCHSWTIVILFFKFVLNFKLNATKSS